MSVLNTPQYKQCLYTFTCTNCNVNINYRLNLHNVLNKRKKVKDVANG